MKCKIPSDTVQLGLNNAFTILSKYFNIYAICLHFSQNILHASILCDALIFCRAILSQSVDVTDKQLLFNLILSVNVNYLKTIISFSFDFYCKPCL